jgi:GT2 family glycosyltransferase
MQRVVEFIHNASQARRQVAIGTKCGVKPVEKARNEAVKEFLASPYSWLIQIDNDVVPPQHFLKVIDWAEADRKLVFGIPTPIDDLSWNVGRTNEKDNSQCNRMVTLPRGWNQCDFVGTGFLAVHRSVVEAIRSDWFSSGPTRSEDYAFCDRVKTAGFQVWFNGDYQCDHIKSLSLLPSMEKSCEITVV